AITVDGELAVLRRQLRGCDTLDELLAGHPVSDQVLHRDEPQTVAPGKAFELGDAGHGAVGICHLAYHPDRCEAGEPAKVDRGLGLASANEHATLPCL